MNEIPSELAEWLAKVAVALNGVGHCKVSYGEFHLGDIQVCFDGEDTGICIGASEHDSKFVIRLEGATS